MLIKLIVSIMLIFDAVIRENRAEPMIRKIIARQTVLLATYRAINPELVRMAMSEGASSYVIAVNCENTTTPDATHLYRVVIS